MAKSKSFFGMRRGSTKSLTFAVMNGVQITKDRVSEVKNPRSIQQMKQRCFLKTTALGYGSMKAIVDHSFQGFSYGSMSMRQFMKLNTPLVMEAAGDSRPSFGYAPYGDSTTNMGQFIISDGTLSSVPSNAVSLKFDANSLEVKYNGGGNSVSKLADSLGCNLGDIATICALCQNNAGVVKFVWLRLILPTTDGTISSDSVKFESDVRFSVSYGAQLVATISFDEVDGITTSAAALFGVIRSQKSDTGWLRSKTRLNLSVGSVRYLDDYSTALLTYPTGQPYILNGDTTEEKEDKPLPTFAVVVDNATSAVINGAGSFAEGTNVTISATSVPNGKLPVWNNVPDGSGSTTTIKGNSISFTMPAENVNISFTLEDIVYYEIQNTSELDQFSITCSPTESITEGEEVIFACETDEPASVLMDVSLHKVSDNSFWKKLPDSLFEGNRHATWSIEMPPFDLKVVVG